MPTTEPGPAQGDSLGVEVVHAWPERCWSRVLALPRGATVADALAAVTPALVEQGLSLATLGVAVFGRTVAATTRLHDGDRIELLRPLQVDPRQARANRAAAARRKPGAPGRSGPR